MIRGAQKKMIVIRTHDSRVFEEAYFVMRRDSEATIGDSDMLTEADRIIRRSTSGHTPESPFPRRECKRPWVGRLAWFVSGLLLGGGIGCLLSLL